MDARSRLATTAGDRAPRTRKPQAMTLYECEERGAEYTSPLARDHCEDDDRENRFER